MKTQQGLSEFAAACAVGSNVACVWHAALVFFHARGIRRVSYLGGEGLPTRPEGQGGSPEFPESWVCDFVQGERYRIVPAPPASDEAEELSKWYDLAERNATAAKSLLYQGGSDQGGCTGTVFFDGLAFQVFGPQMRNAYLTLTFKGAARALSSEAVFELHSAGQIAHIRSCELVADSRRDTLALSRREHEVLRWIAQGKTNGVIAEILGISRHTVDTLIRRLYEKLDVNDRTTAAIKGLGMGLLHYGNKGVM